MTETAANQTAPNCNNGIRWQRINTPGGTDVRVLAQGSGSQPLGSMR
jgi:hypothetical protein